MSFSFGAGVRDSLSNLAASLGAGRDKAAHDAFTVFDLDRSQIEAMYRGDWLARKVVDVVPYDMVREWRAWSGHGADVARIEAAERRLGLRVAVQRAMVLGRLYGGGAIVIGDGEPDPAALARPLDERLARGGLKFLHAVSRWQLGATALDRNPLSPWCGEPAVYELFAAGQAPLRLHPSRVVRFLGNALPDPSLSGSCWSDSVLQTLYDAVHAVALTTAGATSLMHEAKVDVVTVPNLSEHLSSAETTEQLSARFAYAAAMKSINNLLLLGDGESWARQRIDFGGLPEMVRCFLQVAAGAADIPVTRLLGQSPAGLSATGDSDTRNYYDMIAARQELDLRPQLERLDRLILRSEGIDPDALTFAFRPLWQLDGPAQAALALSRAQATQIYAGLKLWPAAVTARLVEAQLVADGTYPNAAALFADGGGTRTAGQGTADGLSAGLGALHYLTEPRNAGGEWTTGTGPTPRDQPDLRPTLVSDPEKIRRHVEEGLAGGAGPLDDPVLPEGEDPIVKPIPGASSHGLLETVPSPLTALPVFPRSPLVPPASRASPAPVASTIAGPSQPATPVVPKMGGAPPAPTSQEIPGRSPVQVGQNSPSYFPEFEDDPIYKFFRDRFTASSGDLAALKSQMPDDIARHMIDGFIGPGPYAQTPIELSPMGKFTDEMIEENDIIGYGFGCHRCGVLDPGTGNGHFILDHQMPKKLNFGDWKFYLYPHCQSCMQQQGGHVRVIRSRIRREGFIP